MGTSQVDVHCHLAEVLQDVRRRQVAPSLEKSTSELTDEEAEHWKILEWIPSGEPKPLRGVDFPDFSDGRLSKNCVSKLKCCSP